MGQLSAALADVARQHGAEIRTGTTVTKIILDGNRAVGVLLSEQTPSPGDPAADQKPSVGQAIATGAILSNADPRRTFFGLVGPDKLEPRFTRQVRNIIYRGSTAKVNLALGGLPLFNGQSDPAQLSGRIRISPSLDYLERAYDDAKYGRISAHPYLDIAIPTLADPALAPAGQHIMSITMQYAPFDLRSGDWNTRRERLGDLIIDTLSDYAPTIRELILQRQVITPLDWQQRYGLTEGSIFHGQMGLDQLLVMRPVPGWSQYRTPIDNLYLCGAGSHPGGGVTGVPGYNAAREVLKDLK
jgi:phytoene dehydrogenase-like protein